MQTREPHRRRRTWLGTLLRALALCVALVLGGSVALEHTSFKAFGLRGAMRDYLALARVEGHGDLIVQAAAEAAVEPTLVAAVMLVESGGRLGARSQKNALGLMQLTLATASDRAGDLGLEAPSEELLLSDGALNVRLGAAHLAWLLARYDGNELQALCAYNAGPSKLARIVEDHGGFAAWRELRARDGESEILGYAERVLLERDRLRFEGLFQPAASPVLPSEASPPFASPEELVRELEALGTPTSNS